MINARVNSPKSRPRKRLVFDSNDDTPTPVKRRLEELESE